MYVTKKGKQKIKTEIEKGEVKRYQNCEAKMIARRKKDMLIWEVTSFEEMHNHERTTPTRRHLLRSHRKVSHVKKSLVDKFSTANISTTHQMGVLDLRAGGFESTGCTEEDLRDYEGDKR